MPDHDRAVAAALSDGSLGRPALVASDLDGTLLDSQGRLSRRSVAAIDRLHEQGRLFVIATARPPRWMQDFAEIIGEHGLAICSNGAYVYDMTRQTVVSERALARDTVLGLVAELRAAVPGIGFAVESSAGFAREPSYADVHAVPPGASVGAVEDLLDHLPGKLLARAPAVDEQEFLQVVTEIVGEAAIVAYSGAGGLAEISAAGVTKAAVLAEWAAERGVSSPDVWAFGDMPNDLAMLEWAGASFAVANAHPDVLAAASYTVAENDDDGVASTIELLG